MRLRTAILLAAVTLISKQAVSQSAFSRKAVDYALDNPLGNQSSMVEV